MKKIKIIGIGIAIALFLTSFAIAEQTTIDKEETKSGVSLDVDAPVWGVGDSWTYKMEYYAGDEHGNLLYTFACDLTLTVVDDTGDSYMLEGTGDSVSGRGIFEGGLEVRLTPFTSVGVEVELRKSDLGIVQWTHYFKGITLFILGGFPLPMQIELACTSVSDPTWAFIPFPLFDDKTGTLENTKHLEEHNVWLLWRLIHAGTTPNHWEGGHPTYTVTEETIGCEAGSYDVFYVNAEIDYDKGGAYYRTYYAEEIGNIVIGSVHSDWGMTGETGFEFDFELLSTTYES